jgi:hypothetical protein
MGGGGGGAQPSIGGQYGHGGMMGVGYGVGGKGGWVEGGGGVRRSNANDTELLEYMDDDWWRQPRNEGVCVCVCV